MSEQKENPVVSHEFVSHAAPEVLEQLFKTEQQKYLFVSCTTPEVLDALKSQSKNVQKATGVSNGDAYSMNFHNVPVVGYHCTATYSKNCAEVSAKIELDRGKYPLFAAIRLDVVHQESKDPGFVVADSYREWGWRVNEMEYSFDPSEKMIAIAKSLSIPCAPFVGLSRSIDLFEKFLVQISDDKSHKDHHHVKMLKTKQIYTQDQTGLHGDGQVPFMLLSAIGKQDPSNIIDVLGRIVSKLNPRDFIKSDVQFVVCEWSSLVSALSQHESSKIVRSSKDNFVRVDCLIKERYAKEHTTQVIFLAPLEGDSAAEFVTKLDKHGILAENGSYIVAATAKCGCCKKKHDETKSMIFGRLENKSYIRYRWGSLATMLMADKIGREVTYEPDFCSRLICAPEFAAIADSNRQYMVMYSPMGDRLVDAIIDVLGR